MTVRLLRLLHVVFVLPPLPLSRRRFAKRVPLGEILNGGALVPIHHSYGHCCESKIISVDNPSGLWIDRRVCDRESLLSRFFRIVSFFLSSFFFFSSPPLLISPPPLFVFPSSSPTLFSSPFLFRIRSFLSLLISSAKKFYTYTIFHLVKNQVRLER